MDVNLINESVYRHYLVKELLNVQGIKGRKGETPVQIEWDGFFEWALWQ